MFLRESSMRRVQDTDGIVHLVLQDGAYIIGGSCHRMFLGPRNYPGMETAGATEATDVPIDTSVTCPGCLASMRDPAVNT